ncbi:MAG: hypothetical protein ACLFR2_08190 [Candidatus Kapaibacterium sp.]
MKKLLSILAMIFLITSCGEDSSGPSPAKNTDWHYFYGRIASIDKIVAFRVNENGDVKLVKENSRIVDVRTDRFYYFEMNDEENSSLFYSDLDGQNEVVLIENITNNLDRIDISGDEKTLVYNYDELTYLVDIESGVKNLIDFNGEGYRFSPNSGKIITKDIYNVENFVLKVYDINLASTTDLLTLEPDTEYGNVCWSESGEEIIFNYIDKNDENLPGKLIKIDVSDGSNEIIYEFAAEEVEDNFAGEVFYYNDGSKIFWYNYENKKLITMNSDGSGVKKTKFNYDHCMMNWDPLYSSNEIYLGTGSEADATIHIYNLDTGESRIFVNDVLNKVKNQIK